MKKMDRTVDTSMPPNTAVPSELRAAAPAPVATHQRHHAQDEGEGGHEDGPQADLGRLDRGLHDGLAPLAQLLGELDDEDRVLARQAHQHDQPTWQKTSLARPRSHCAPSAPMTARGTEQDDEGQGEALVLGGQHQVDEDAGPARR